MFKGRIGKGNFGEVYDGDYLGTRVAIKKLYFVNDELMQKYIEREMDTLTSKKKNSINTSTKNLKDLNNNKSFNFTLIL